MKGVTIKYFTKSVTCCTQWSYLKLLLDRFILMSEITTVLIWRFGWDDFIVVYFKSVEKIVLNQDKGKKYFCMGNYILLICLDMRSWSCHAFMRVKVLWYLVFIFESTFWYLYGIFKISIVLQFFANGSVI